MRNNKFKRIVLFACVLFVQPILTPGSFALARKKTPPRAFSFIAEGGRASQGECDGERKLPRLKRLKEFSKYNSYMGSELQEPELKGKADEEMWKHFFRVKASCNAVLAKTPSSVKEEVLKSNKGELPPDDADDSEDDARPTETPEAD